MTGYTVHTGSSDQFAAGWDRIFGNSKKKNDKQSKKKSPKAKEKKSKKK